MKTHRLAFALVGVLLATTGRASDDKELAKLLKQLKDTKADKRIEASQSRATPGAQGSGHRGSHRRRGRPAQPRRGGGRVAEAWDITGRFRASMYMRAAAIWALEMTRPPAP